MTGLRNTLLISTGILCGVAMGQCAVEEKPMTYQVVRANPESRFDHNWDGDFWKDITPLELQQFMGERPAHFPRVQAKLAYDDDAVYVIFQVDDRYVRAVARQHQDAVYKDSCVEFFFTPHTDITLGYFNLEMNCGGTMLLHYQRMPRKDSAVLPAADLSRIDVGHSLPKNVDPEITEPTSWTVAYRLPIEIFRKHFPAQFQRPAPGVTWRANLYKCADDTSHPHWLTWNPVEFERPDFHRPESFGVLEFQ